MIIDASTVRPIKRAMLRQQTRLPLLRRELCQLDLLELHARVHRRHVGAEHHPLGPDRVHPLADDVGARVAAGVEVDVPVARGHPQGVLREEDAAHVAHDDAGVGTGGGTLADLERESVGVVAAVNENRHPQFPGQAHELDHRRRVRRQDDRRGMELHPADAVLTHGPHQEIARPLAVPGVDAEVASRDAVRPHPQRLHEARVGRLVVTRDVGQPGDAALVDAPLVHDAEEDIGRVDPCRSGRRNVRGSR